MKRLILLLISLSMLTGLTGFAQNAALDNIFSRKSVRSYTDQDVTPEQVETILKAAMAAPSGMNVQPWRFVVIRNQDTRTRSPAGTA